MLYACMNTHAHRHMHVHMFVWLSSGIVQWRNLFQTLCSECWCHFQTYFFCALLPHCIIFLFRFPQSTFRIRKVSMKSNFKNARGMPYTQPGSWQKAHQLKNDETWKWVLTKELANCTECKCSRTWLLLHLYNLALTSS